MNENNSYFFENEKLEKEVLKEVSKNKKEIIKSSFEGETIWIKRARATKSNIFHRFFYFFFKVKGLFPVEKKSKNQALKHEVNKLIRLKKNNIHVPKVLGYTNECFVLEDTGTTIKSFLKSKELKKSVFENRLKETLHLLIKIHNLGEYHGGPQVKNYTFKNGIISAIDFEDSFDKNLDLEEIQFRDFFLFLFSLTELKKDIDYKELIEIYMKETKKYEIDKELKSIALKLQFLTKIIENKLFYNLFFDDVINTYKLIKTLQKL